MPTRSREYYLSKADELLRKSSFSREDDALVRALHGQAVLVDSHDGHGADGGELRKWEDAIRAIQPGVREFRDMGISTGNLGGYLVPAGFRELLVSSMKQADELFSPGVITWFLTSRGGPVTLPLIDDLTSSASVVGEGTGPSTELDPMAGAVTLPNAQTWRSGRVSCSYELLQDSAFPVAQFLADAFAVRFARTVGSYLATTLVSSANLGATAAGDANSGGTGANSVGYGDLLALRRSVDPAYRRSPKCFWCMNDNTLAALDGLLDKQGHPILDAGDLDDNGRRLILGYPVAICPSLDSIATTKKPILFGAMNYFVLRNVAPATSLMPYTDAPGYAEYGKLAFQGYFRGNAALLNITSSPPVKYLQNA